MPAPQSETLEYRWFPISSQVRFVLYAILMAGGLFMQFMVYFPGHSAAGLIVLIVGSLLMIGSTYTKIPADLGYEEWKPVTKDKFDRVLHNYALVKQARIPIYLKKKEGMILYIIVSIFSLIFLGIFSAGSSNIIFLLVALDLAIFLYPLFLSGHVQVHAPKDMGQKMERFHAVMLLEKELETLHLQLTPFFRFDKDSKGNQIPEDVRLMLDAKNKPSDLIGIQLQISINNGQNGRVPYMYGVVIFSNNSPKRQVLEKASWSAPGTSLLTELGEQGEFSFLIIRQRTEDGGYHTTNEQCQAIVRKIAENITIL